MSKKNNINPDHYKTAGRERQGENVTHDVYKRRYTKSKTESRANNSKKGAGKYSNRRRGRAAIR